MNQPKLNPGETYVGLATDIDGKTVHHVVLLPGDVEKNWHDAKAWAASIGGELPTRTEALLLFRTQRDAFKRDLYWTSEQRAGGPSYAWYQGFAWGNQSNGGLSWEFLARAVRRVLVGEGQ
jgi:hypothetical protein